MGKSKFMMGLAVLALALILGTSVRAEAASQNKEVKKLLKEYKKMNSQYDTVAYWVKKSDKKIQPCGKAKWVKVKVSKPSVIKLKKQIKKNKNGITVKYWGKVKKKGLFFCYL